MENLDSYVEDVLEVLDGYAAETPDGNDPTILKRWITEHPAYSQELLDFAVSRTTSEFINQDDFQSEQEKLEFTAMVRRVFAEVFSPPDRFEGFIKRIESLKMKKAEFLGSTGISPGILNSLENRAIEFSTIPRRFIGRLAEKLNAPVESISEYLQQPVMAAQFHKNSSRPEAARTVTFSDAVKSDLELSDDQKNNLLSLDAE